MISFETTARKWGNSLGLTMPKEIVQNAKIRENEKLRILVIKQRPILKQTFGMIKGKVKKSTQKIKDELREELYND
jgi:antitoxin component of MazEF toxin-antitoxin module